MLLKNYFLEQLEREAVASRKVIERVPEGHNSWKPHARSMELGYLAALVATMPGWPSLMIDRDELDLSDPTFRTKPLGSRAELLAALDEAVAQSRRSLENTNEAHLNTNWQLKAADQVLAKGPRYAMIADAVLSHLAHHRGQLTVYLRLKEASVPAIYGPSADEQH
ncbi:MAG TPA: DinB family protein [Acidobacteriaceae bacterium]|nr:DinB family protein [Acidobacteriaceae bacterium]